MDRRFSLTSCGEAPGGKEIRRAYSSYHLYLGSVNEFVIEPVHLGILLDCVSYVIFILDYTF